MKTLLYDRIIRDLIIFWVGIFLAILTWENNLLATFFVLTIYFFRARFWYEPGDHIFFSVGGLLGTTTEVIATHVGVWKYANPTFLNIPIWLPFGWGFASVLIIRIAQNFIKKD